MLEHYFCNPRTLYQLRLGPLGGLIDELAGKIRDEGYSRWTARTLLKGAAHLRCHIGRTDDLPGSLLGGC